MDENRIKKRLFRATAGSIAAVVMILAVGTVLMIWLFTFLDQTSRSQMKTEAEEYRSRILRQLDQDFQLLDTLAAFMGVQGSMEEESFAQALHQANEENRFISLAYFSQDGQGILSSLGEEHAKDVGLEDLNEETRSLIKRSFTGERGVSHMFDSRIFDGKVFVYSVPVYEKGKITGVLAASDHMNILARILEEETVLNGGGYLHLLGTEGDFLIRSDNAVVEESTRSIFDGPYIREEEKEAIRKAMAAQKPAASSFRYKGREYLFNLEPVGINGWYVFCVDTKEGANDAVYRVTNLVAAATAGILGVVVVFLSLGYYVVRKNNQELLDLAYYDPLTGALNYPAFLKGLEEKKKQSGAYYIAAVNIHQFKFVNELFGKEQGDRLLCFVQKSLENCLKEGEFFCRETGDLFYLCLNEDTREEVRRRLETVMEKVSSASVQEGHNYRILLYCGAVEGGGDSAMTHVLFALAKAKEIQRNSVWFYDEELHRTEELENYIETHMHQALQDGEFKLFLQPKMDLEKGGIGGAEALVRWQTADGRFLNPGQFIPLFERNGFCTQLDMYMVESVCRQIREWLDQGICPVPVSVNQSRLLFYETDYITKLCSLAEKYNIPPAMITLEILEGLAVNHLEKLNDKILILQEKGFKISMDDFGSGYSSLNTLCNLKINELKLDRGFLMQASQDQNSRSAMILEHIVQLSKSFQVTTVAEGVETEANHQLIRSLGCDYGQGYYYSRPISAEEFNQLYMKQRKKTARP